jgi:transcription initiation factor TFIID subunit 6
MIRPPPFSKENVLSVGDAVGIKSDDLSDAVSEEIIRDCEDKLRIIIEDAIQFMKRSNRNILTVQDINDSLSLKSCERIYGYSNSHKPIQLNVVSRDNNEKLYFIDDEVVSFESLINLPLPKCPALPTFTTHWLSVAGTQPNIKENHSQIRREELERERLTNEAKQSRGQPGQRRNVTDTRQQLAHTLSLEEKLYLEKVLTAVRGSDAILCDATLERLQNDEGLHQLVPYFTRFIADQVCANINNLPLLFNLMKMTRALLLSNHIYLELYLHQLLPPILSCLVAKRICADPWDADHWVLREWVAQEILAVVCQKHGGAYVELQPRITRTLTRALLDPKKALTAHFGAIKGLASLGPETVNSALLSATSSLTSSPTSSSSATQPSV